MRKLIIKKSPIHGMGLYAGEDIPWGERIIRYIGELISDKEAARREAAMGPSDMNDIFELGKNKNLDGSKGGGKARYINHSRDKANCFVLREKGQIWIVAGIEGVKKGEELLYDYGTEYFPKKKKR